MMRIERVSNTGWNGNPAGNGEAVAIFLDTNWKDDGAAKKLLDSVADWLYGALSRCRFSGKHTKPVKGFTSGLEGGGSMHIYVAGVGGRDLPTRRHAQAAEKIGRAAKKDNVTTIHVQSPPSAESEEDRQILIGLQLGTRDRFSTDPATRKSAVKTIAWYGDDYPFDKIESQVKAIGLAQDLGDLPPNLCPPETFAKMVFAALGLHDKEPVSGRKYTAEWGEVVCYDRDWMVEQGFELAPAVTAGSDTGAMFLHITIFPVGDVAKIVGFVGKGILFDTGGLDLKTTRGMSGMRFDKAGAGAVAGTAVYLSRHRPQHTQVELVCVIGANKTGSAAYMPSAQYTLFEPGVAAEDRRSIEIGNTDAEGRLMVIDGNAYLLSTVAALDLLVNLYTLTGVSILANGKRTAGAFTDDEFIRDDFSAAAEAAGERVAWGDLSDDALWDSISADTTATIRSCDPDTSEAGHMTAYAVVNTALRKDMRKKHLHIDHAGPSVDKKHGCTGYGTKSCIELVSLMDDSVPAGDLA